MDAQCSMAVHRSWDCVPSHEEAVSEASTAELPYDKVKECHQDQLQAVTKQDPPS